jgi:hypothetical protein
MVGSAGPQNGWPCGSQLELCFFIQETIMPWKIDKVDVWSGEIRDEVGGVAAALRPLVAAGADFSFVIARRRPEKPGSGIVFFSGLRGSKQTRAAESAGFAKSTSVIGLRLEAPDKPGLLQDVVTTLATAEINVRGVTASVGGTRCVMLLAFDDPADRDKAARLLRK